MHELSIALSIVEAAQEEAGRHGGAQVSAVHLKVGLLSGVVKEALLFSYTLACEETPLAGSTLMIEEVPVVIYCQKCEERRAASFNTEFLLSGMRNAGGGGRAEAEESKWSHWRSNNERRTTPGGSPPECHASENDRLAHELRERFRKATVSASISLVSSPGSGKTAFLEKTLTMLRETYRVAALVGDLATDNDAVRLGPQPGPGQANHHRDGLPLGGRNDRARHRRMEFG